MLPVALHGTGTRAASLFQLQGDLMAGLRGNGAGLADILFGDGFDKDQTISADLVLLRDMAYNNLTIKNGVRIISNGYKIRVRAICTIEGDAGNVAIVSNNGANARNSNGSTAEVSGTIPFPTSGGFAGTTGGGGQGGQGAYNGGSDASNGFGIHDAGISPGTSTLVPGCTGSSAPFYFLGGAGGRGGDAQAWVTGTLIRYFGVTGSSGTIPSISVGAHRSFFGNMAGGTLAFPNANTGSFFPFAGGGGGGGGACGNSGSIGVRPRGGWGGGGGGVVYIAARELRLLGNIQSRGGNGGNSFSFGAPGSGGGGGFAHIIYGSLLLRKTLRDHIDVAPGQPGLGYAAASITAATPGQSGSFYIFGV